MKITVRIKNNYGQDVVYPVCSDAEKFAWIAGTKTLTAHTIRLIGRLGYQIDVETPALEV